jgi:hypothetical protein
MALRAKTEERFMLNNKFANSSINKTLKSNNLYSDLFILFGAVNKVVIFSSIKIIEEKLGQLNYGKSTITKAKLVAVELLENMLKHQLESASLNPYFSLSIFNGELQFTTGNCVSVTNYHFLNDKLKEYENMSSLDIKELYMKQLSEGDLDEKGNAGLGILTVMKKTNKRYDYDIEKISDQEYYFNSTISLNQLN